MPHWFRTQSRSSCHPDGKPGLLQIYQFRNKQKSPGQRLCENVGQDSLSRTQTGEKLHARTAARNPAKPDRLERPAALRHALIRSMHGSA